MSDFLQLLKNNRNYRYTWSGQVVSEIGDHFNNVAVFSLALANTRSGMVVTGVMLARAIPAQLSVMARISEFLAIPQQRRDFGGFARRSFKRKSGSGHPART